MHPFARFAIASSAVIVAYFVDATTRALIPAALFMTVVAAMAAAFDRRPLAWLLLVALAGGYRAYAFQHYGNINSPEIFFVIFFAMFVGIVALAFGGIVAGAGEVLKSPVPRRAVIVAGAIATIAMAVVESRADTFRARILLPRVPVLATLPAMPAGGAEQRIVVAEHLIRRASFERGECVIDVRPISAPPEPLASKWQYRGEPGDFSGVEDECPNASIQYEPKSQFLFIRFETTRDYYFYGPGETSPRITIPPDILAAL